LSRLFLFLLPFPTARVAFGFRIRSSFFPFFGTFSQLCLSLGTVDLHPFLLPRPLLYVTPLFLQIDHGPSLPQPPRPGPPAFPSFRSRCQCPLPLRFLPKPGPSSKTFRGHYFDFGAAVAFFCFFFFLSVLPLPPRPFFTFNPDIVSSFSHLLFGPFSLLLFLFYSFLTATTFLPFPLSDLLGHCFASPGWPRFPQTPNALGPTSRSSWVHVSSVRPLQFAPPRSLGPTWLFFCFFLQYRHVFYLAPARLCPHTHLMCPHQPSPLR